MQSIKRRRIIDVPARWNLFPGFIYPSCCENKWFGCGGNIPSRAVLVLDGFGGGGAFLSFPFFFRCVFPPQFSI